MLNQKSAASDTMASFEKSRFDDSKTDENSAPIVKKKLCRVSNGYANSRSLLGFHEINETRNKVPTSCNTLSDSIAKEIGRDHLVEIHVVRGNCTTDQAAEALPCSITHKQKAESKNASVSAVIERENRILNEDKRHSMLPSGNKLGSKRVGFAEDITVYSFEPEEEPLNDVEYEELSEMFDEVVPCYEKFRNGTGDSPCTREPNKVLEDAFYPKKTPLRRVILGQMTRACSKASLFRSFLGGSFRKTKFSPGLKRPLVQSKSLPDSSVCHSFVSADDQKEMDVQLVIPLGQHYLLNSIVVKTSGDGRKIKVTANRKTSTTCLAPEDFRHDYHECFHLPKAIDPCHTRATIDYKGYLKVEAQFASSTQKVPFASSKTRTGL